MSSPGFQPVAPELNDLSKTVVDSIYKVHRALGPGLLESSYRLCLVHELHRRDVNVKQEVTVPVEYEGIKLDNGYRMDILVEESLVIEVKTVDAILAIHRAQLLSYLKHANKRLGLLVNFNTVLIKDGIQRVVNG